MWEVLEKKIEMFNVPLVEFQGVILCSVSILGEEEQCITHLQIEFHAWYFSACTLDSVFLVFCYWSAESTSCMYVLQSTMH
jgi:hypothetical protein